MRILVRGGRAAGTVWAALALAAALAVSSHWLRHFRLASPERSAIRVVRVTSGADSGPGSLREAILEADHAVGRVRIVIMAERIAVETPLPPLVNPAGVVIESKNSRTVLDASRLAGGPVLDVAAPDCVIVGLRIERAPAQAVLIRRTGAHLRAMSIVDSAGGVHQMDGASNLVVEDSTFERNAEGIHVAADGAPVRLQNNRFQGHRRTAIWAVAAKRPPLPQPAEVEIVANRFTADFQPLIVFNVQARIERNTFDSARNAAVYVNGAGTVIKNNRIRAGRNFGIVAEQLDHGLIANNEVDHNCSGGVIVRDSGDTDVRFNRVYANGYGIILVHGRPTSPNTIVENLIAQHSEDGLYVIGGSPIVRRNTLLQNRKAGVRLSSSTDAQRHVLTPEPLLEANILNGNGNNEVHRDKYTPREALIASEPAECSWRLGGAPVTLAALQERR